MQAITTTYRGATNTRGSRIIARCDAGSVTVSWDYGTNTEKNHINAAVALMQKLDWAPCEFVTGFDYQGRGCHVFTASGISKLDKK